VGRNDFARAAEQAALGPIYAVLMALRDLMWRARRPVLVGVRALVVRDGHALLIRHRSGRMPWSLPGGGAERYERLAEAAEREAREETGADVRADYLLGVYDRFGGGVTNYIAVFICSPVGASARTGAEPQPPRSLEIAEARFFPLAAPPAGLDSGSRRRIAEFLAGERGVTRQW
jgi:ADP-ribose pyrophosphatase YjhB (NUDIX family)